MLMMMIHGKIWLLETLDDVDDDDDDKRKEFIFRNPRNQIFVWPRLGLEDPTASL